MARPGVILAAPLALAGFVGIAGCAQRPLAVPPATAPAMARTRPSGPAYLTLDQIRPAPVLPPPRATNPAARPSLDALELFARARGENLSDHRLAAIPLLERAVALDPDSYELHCTLADVYRGSRAYEDHSIAELEKAAALEPDHLDVQLDLGRQYLAKGNSAKALEHLRLAIQTQAYKAGGGRSPETDLFLAHALQQQGYDRAALQRYEMLLARLGKRDLSRSADPDLAYQVSDKLYAQVGDLYLRQGDAPAALAAYRAALRDAGHGHDAQDPALHARVVRVLLITGRNDEAVAAAAEAVRECRASSESVKLLREACRAAHRPGGAERELARLHEQDPGNRPVLLALADVLRTAGRGADADQMLARAAEQSPGDAMLLRKRAELREADGELQAAARLLIEATARRPDLAGELEDVWQRLLRPADPQARRRLSLQNLQTLSVAPGAEAARLHAVSRYARRWPRLGLARAALSRAVAARPVYAPAFRDQLEWLWADGSRTRDTKIRRTEQLCRSAEEAGAESLASELKGRALLARGDAVGAAAALAEAVRLSGGKGTAGATADSGTGSATGGKGGTISGAIPGADPELQLVFAESYRAFGDDAGFERLLRKLIAAYPTFDAARVALHDHYLERGSASEAEAVIAGWRDAEPGALAPRLYQARDLLRVNHAGPAEIILTGLLEEYPDEPEVLATCRTLYARTRRPDEYARQLRAVVARQPRAFQAAQALARAEAAANRRPDAVRVLDAARAAAADEPDVLYDLSREYARLDLRRTAEEVLEQVLRLDPSHAAAGNDLAYAWAEQGRNLERAESLARAATQDDPENVGFLDTLGWVLYKWGRFEEARQFLEQAVGATALAAVAGSDAGASAEDSAPAAAGAPGAAEDATNPVLLDHLGDVMYRLNDAATAGKLWEHSRARLGELAGAGEGPAPARPAAPPAAPDAPREDLGPLRLQLQQKQRQLKAGRPVSVAPVAESLRKPAPAAPAAPAASTTSPVGEPGEAGQSVPATRAARVEGVPDGG